MLITVVVVFTLCWLPYHVYLLLAFFVHNGECPISPQYIFFGLLLGHTNSAINPCIYVIFNRDFRQGFLEFLRTCSSCCRGNNTDVRMESNSQCATFRDTAMQPLNLNSAQYPLSLITDQLVRRGSCSSRALLTPPIVHRAPSLGDAEEIVAVWGWNRTKEHFYSIWSCEASRCIFSLIRRLNIKRYSCDCAKLCIALHRVWANFLPCVRPLFSWLLFSLQNLK